MTAGSEVSMPAGADTRKHLEAIVIWDQCAGVALIIQTLCGTEGFLTPFDENDAAWEDLVRITKHEYATLRTIEDAHRECRFSPALGLLWEVQSILIAMNLMATAVAHGSIDGSHHFSSYEIRVAVQILADQLSDQFAKGRPESWDLEPRPPKKAG